MARVMMGTDLHGAGDDGSEAGWSAEGDAFCRVVVALQHLLEPAAGRVVLHQREHLLVRRLGVSEPVRRDVVILVKRLQRLSQDGDHLLVRVVHFITYHNKTHASNLQGTRSLYSKLVASLSQLQDFIHLLT